MSREAAIRAVALLVAIRGDLADVGQSLGVALAPRSRPDDDDPPPAAPAQGLDETATLAATVH